MRTKVLLVVAALGLCAQPARAEGLLGTLARQAAGALAQKAVEGAVAGRAKAPAKSRAPAPAKPPADDLDGLSEAEREKACNRRVPLDADGGRSYEKQVAFGKCMGPRWGEGA